MNKTMMTDLYELTMAQTYYNENKKDEIVYFDVFYRKNPFNGGYAISGGLEQIINYIENFKFDEKRINYLKQLKIFNDNFLDYLKNLKFTGDIYAIPDGTPIFPNEPIITVKAPIIVAQIIETALLASFNYETLITTSSKRLCNAAINIPIMEFGARRASGIEGAITASKCGYIGGCSGTSNTEAGYLYDIPVMGTMAHSLVTEEKNEYDAFLGYVKNNPYNTVLLVDTYDTLKSGIPNAIKVYNDYLKPNGYKLNGIRIDSGDLVYLSKMARKMLDEAGLYDTKICLSNGLDEESINDLIKNGATFDSIGAGDNIAAPKERIGGVYKLVAVENEKIEPRIKVSDDSVKTINPGYKKVYRFYDKQTGFALGDVIALYDEKISKNKYTLIHPIETWKQKEITNYNLRELQVPIYQKGKLVYNLPNVNEIRNYCAKEFETIYPEIKRKVNPHEYYVDLSVKLLELKNKLIAEHKNVKKLIK